MFWNWKSFPLSFKACACSAVYLAFYQRIPVAAFLIRSLALVDWSVFLVPVLPDSLDFILMAPLIDY